MGLGTAELINTWGKALPKIKKSLNDNQVFDAFFADSYLDSLSDGEATIIVNSSVAAAVLDRSYSDMVCEVLNELSGEDCTVSFLPKGERKSKTAKVQKEPIKPVYFKDSFLNPSYTFETFVTGQSNKEAYQASLMASQNPGKLYNPILIYGNSGLGKTHLLHAIGNGAKKKNPELRVLYVHAQEFLDEYIKYVKGDKEGVSIVDWFKSSVDLLLVDDIQFLADKKSTEETFFSIFNNFYANGKQIVITSDQHPSKLNGLDDRLKSRFVQGLPLSIGAPERETCENILKLRLANSGLKPEDFDKDALEFLASRFGKNVRELEGAFDRVLFYTTTIQETNHIDLKTVKRAVSGLIDVKEDEGRLTEEKIIATVADYYGVAPYQVTGSSRVSQVAMARHISMYLIRTLLDTPFTKIGKCFGGKDHATVMSAVNKVEKQLKTDKNLEKSINTLKAKLKP